jgi:3-hydroxyisobutyrate dehydrogenase-like beta-hydroxyacid dehydrogenase
MKLAFIGLGRMGTGIARNLLRAGHELTVYNRTPAKVQALANDGAHIAASAADAVRSCEAVFTMLADDAAVSDVVFGAEGIASALPYGAAHISISTISVATAKYLAAEHAARKQGYISSPVFGRPEAAESGKLLVVAAGPSDLVKHFLPVFEAIGRHTYNAGEQAWQANLIKLCGNFMIASMMESLGETFATMRKAGVDRHLFHEIISELFGSPIYKGYGSAIADEKFEPAGFALKLGLKDVRLVVDAASALESPMPFASILRDHFISAMAHGQEQMDWSSVALVAARMAGLNEQPKEK